MKIVDFPKSATINFSQLIKLFIIIFSKMKIQVLLILLMASLFTGCKVNNNEEKPNALEQKSTTNNEEIESTVQHISNVEWKTEKISEAILYKYHNFSDLFNSIQSVTIIEIDLNQKVRVDISYLTSGFLKTSEAGLNVNATAAINGSYFDTSKGGSTVFFKKDGEVINDTRENFTHYRENAGFAINASGNISIHKKPSLGWHAVTSSTLLTSGPLLIYNGKLIEQVDEKFNTNRHPRTAIGITDDNRLIAAVVDGRNNQAEGMTIHEVATLMQALGCKEAMNLDGGGSSTAWVENLGVVNYPSDNKIFDHEGERGVANVITFTQE